MNTITQVEKGGLFETVSYTHLGFLPAVFHPFFCQETYHFFRKQSMR